MSFKPVNTVPGGYMTVESMLFNAPQKNTIDPKTKQWNQSINNLAQQTTVNGGVSYLLNPNSRQ